MALHYMLTMADRLTLPTNRHDQPQGSLRLQKRLYHHREGGEPGETKWFVPERDGSYYIFVEYSEMSCVTVRLAYHSHPHKKFLAALKMNQCIVP